MKLREILLDFTSLLDVIMIILFWFVISYRQEMRTQVEQAQLAASQAQTEAQEAQQEAQVRQLEAEQALATVRSEAQMSNIDALLDFGQSENITARLYMEDEGWRLSVYKGEDTYLGSIPDTRAQRLGLEFNGLLEAAGYDADDTVLCVFVYDAQEPGTRSAYESITEGFRQIRMGNKHFYCTELDSSVPEEG
ncbi:MAG: hypothetical protein IJ055_06640 [Oscillospiraceae bacterium]|nr:hypothetical protein [Oscillospiraceae bacterium]